MKKDDKTFDEKLLDMEKLNPSIKEKYEKEIKSMLEKKLNIYWRLGFAILSILGLIAAYQFIELASKKFGTELGVIIRIIAILGFLLTLAWIVTLSRIAFKGSFNIMKQNSRIAAIGIALGFFFTLYLLIVYILPITIHEPTNARSILGIYMSLVGFFFVVTIALCLIVSALYRFGYRTREKLLDIELHLAELSDKLESK